MRIVPLILAVALFMENMDATVIATSLPQIADDIGADPISLKLALTAYFVALAIFIPMSGWVADRFGAKNVFRVAIAVFMAGSICCAFSDSLLTFVLSRFLQGIGGSMMTPIARLVLVRATPRNELVAALSWLTIPALIGPISGPPIGGFLSTYLSWHWIFWINIPIGAIGILLVSRFLPADQTRTERPIDVAGLLLSGLCFAGILFGVSVISLPAIPAVAGYAAVVLGLLSGGGYLWHARRTSHPILDPRLFRYRLFRSAVLGNAVFRIGIGAFPFLMPLMLQLSFGLTAFESGLTTFVSALGALVSKFGAERMFAWLGFRTTLAAMSLISGVLLAVNALFTPETPIWLLMAALVGGGLARSMFFSGTNALAFADIDDAHASQAAAISSVMQQLSIAAGVAVAGTALELSATLRGAELALVDFHIAWLVVAAGSALSALFFLWLPPDAGADVSGHRARQLPRTPEPLP